MSDRAEREVLLLLADVSGYTRYMVANRTAALHSQGIITDLLEAVIERVEIPLEVSKLEGDAVFMFAERNLEADWEAICRGIGGRLPEFVEAFDRKLAELAASLSCPCEACRNLDKLRLKVVAHAGRAVRHSVGRFEELTGVDVILVHRLLKNRVQGDAYLLLTDAAFARMQPSDPGSFEAGLLEDKDLGQIPFRVRLLEGPPPLGARPAGLGAHLKTLLRDIRWRLRPDPRSRA